MRASEVGVRDGNGNRGPIGGEPAAEAVGVVASAKVVVPCLGIPLFALEFVIVGGGAVAGVGSALAAKGIEVGVIANHTSVGGHDARSAEQVFDVIRGIAGDGSRAVGTSPRDHRDALAAKENVFGGSVAARVGFGQDVAAGAVPIELADPTGF